MLPKIQRGRTALPVIVASADGGRPLGKLDGADFPKPMRAHVRASGSMPCQRRSRHRRIRLNAAGDSAPP